MFKGIFKLFFSPLIKIYLFIFGRKIFQKINNKLYLLVIKSMGFSNYGDHYQTGEKKFIELIKGELNFCLDIGANIGTYSKLLINNTSSKVFSFEPLEDAFRELEKLANNQTYKDRLKVYNFALGESNKKEKLYYSNTKSQLASFLEDANKLSFVNKKNNFSKIVEIKKLDDFVDVINVDLIKIDTEGYEMNVLKGGINFISKKKPKFIQIEFNWHQLFTNNSLIDFSRELKNYEAFRIIPYGYPLIKVNPERPENNIYHLSNYVFIRRDIANRYI